MARADVVIVASPTYKASYTGLLKAFLDRYPTNGLAAVTAIPLLTIGSPAHTLAVEHTLRPLLVELGASVPTRGIAFAASATDERGQIVSAWLDAEGPVWPVRSRAADPSVRYQPCSTPVGVRPTATGRLEASDHWLHEPMKIRASTPASANASAECAEAIPVLQ